MIFARNISYAQKPDSIPKYKSPTPVYWLALDLGACETIDDELPIALCAILNGEYLHHVFSARILYGAGQQANLIPHEEAFDTGVLYGYGVHNSLWFFNASIGLAYTYVTKRIYVGRGTPYDIFRAETSYGIGLPWQIQMFSKFTESAIFGMGLAICGNVNKFRSFVNLLLTLEMGIY